MKYFVNFSKVPISWRENVLLGMISKMDKFKFPSTMIFYSQQYEKFHLRIDCCSGEIRWTSQVPQTFNEPMLDIISDYEAIINLKRINYSIKDGLIYFHAPISVADIKALAAKLP